MKHSLLALTTVASALAIAACSSLPAGANNDPLALFAQIQTKIQCDVNGVDIGPPNLFNVINFLSQVANNSLVMTCRSKPQPATVAPVAAPASASPVGVQAPAK
jgi:hypothetical protein